MAEYTCTKANATLVADAILQMEDDALALGRTISQIIPAEMAISAPRCQKILDRMAAGVNGGKAKNARIGFVEMSAGKLVEHGNVYRISDGNIGNSSVSTWWALKTILASGKVNEADKARLYGLLRNGLTTAVARKAKAEMQAHLTAKKPEMVTAFLNVLVDPEERDLWLNKPQTSSNGEPTDAEGSNNGDEPTGSVTSDGARETVKPIELVQARQAEFLKDLNLLWQSFGEKGLAGSVQHDTMASIVRQMMEMDSGRAFLAMVEEVQTEMAEAQAKADAQSSRKRRK